VTDPIKETDFFHSASMHFGDDGWYEDKFQKHKPRDAPRVEVCPTYLASSKTVQNIYRRLGPGVKVVIMLREPVLRAWSHYLYTVRHGDNWGPFLSDEHQNPLIFCSTYAERVRKLMEVFDQVLVLADGEPLFPDGYGRLCSFLGAEVRQPEEPVRINQGTMPRLLEISRETVVCKYEDRRTTAKVGSPVLRGFAWEGDPLRVYVGGCSEERLRWHQEEMHKLARHVDPREARRVYRKHFASDVAELRELLGEVPRHWGKYGRKT
jgi:hypothetical protein